MHMFISEAQKGDIEFVCHFEAVNESAIKVTPKSVSFTALGEMLKVMKLHSNGNLIYADDFTVVTKKDNITTVTVINSSCNDISRFKFNNTGFVCCCLVDVNSVSFIKAVVIVSNISSHIAFVEINSS